ncbi:hypothetical protein J5Y03_09440 [Bacillus sp. RG28]|uniref:Uncharacterized protein n=1 Tax=Gottfriedia endophytica TaxID=2820819 RepID=A0A940NJ94_9BACI|nr:hypothetical protein [Gottfriedia endophytica]MBP0725410.1 hypothetical protein [Gottfriedia endophytica]
MSEFFYVICASFVLFFLLFFTNLQLTKVGKIIVFCISIGFSELCHFLSSTYNLYESLAICFILMLATSYLLQNKLNHLIFLQKQQVSKLIIETSRSIKNTNQKNLKNQTNGFFEKDMNDVRNIEELFEKDNQQIRKETVL